VGYTPLFDTLTRGTLCGRWPDIGLWPIVLSLGDKNGVVDVTAEFLASVTGLPLADVLACMKRFCEPDPCSRSQDFNGARLRLIDEHRSWGWEIVNHGKYKEKARLQSKSAREISDGVNAARMADRRGPPQTAADPLSKRIHKQRTADAVVDGLDVAAWEQWQAYRKLKPKSFLAAQKKMAELGPLQMAAVEHSIANGYTGLFAPKQQTNAKEKGQWM
jgi:hypothetical protein